MNYNNRIPTGVCFFPPHLASLLIFLHLTFYSPVRLSGNLPFFLFVKQK